MATYRVTTEIVWHADGQRLTTRHVSEVRAVTAERAIARHRNALITVEGYDAQHIGEAYAQNMADASAWDTAGKLAL